MPSSSIGPKNAVRSLWSHVPQSSPKMLEVGDGFYHLDDESILGIQDAGSEGPIKLCAADYYGHPSTSEETLSAQGHVDSSARGPTPPIWDLPPLAMVEGPGRSKRLVHELEREWQLAPALIEDIYPCTPLQEAAMASTTNRTFRKVYRLSQSLDLDRFRQAWDAFARREPILRTTIVNTASSGPLQIVLQRDIKWKFGGDLHEYIEADASAPMHYGSPLARLALIEDGTIATGCYFIWTIHESLYDALSLGSMLRSVQAEYEGNRDTKYMQLVKAPPFAAFVQYLQHVDGSASKTFWESKLKNAAPKLFPQPPTLGYVPQVDASVYYKLPYAARSNINISVSTIIQAAWALLIGRYSETTDIIFGLTRTGRDGPVPGVADMLGPTIATIPVRVKVVQSQMVADFLHELQEDSIASIPYEHAGLESIRNFDHDCQRACNFQNLLIVQPGALRNGTQWMGDDLFELSSTQSRLSDYSLAIQCGLGDTDIEFAVNWDSNLIHKRQVQRMAHQFRHVFQQLSQISSTATLQDVHFLSEEDKTEVMRWNRRMPPPVDECVHEVILEQMNAHPDTLAIEAWDGSLTYRELECYTSRLAHHLLQLDVSPRDKIPLIFEKSTWAIVAMLAIVRSGCTFVPLDPSSPPSAHQDLIREVDSKIVLSSPAMADRVAGMVRRTVTVSEDSVRMLPLTLPYRLPAGCPTDPICIVYTSENFGELEGVVFAHNAVSTALTHHGSALGFSSKARVFQFASYASEAVIPEIFTTLYHGGCVCIPSEEQITVDLTTTISLMDITLAVLKPDILRLINPSEVPSLDTLLVGGGNLSQDILKKWAGLLNLIAVYGAAESCAISTFAPLSLEDQSSLIGRGIGCLCWIADPADHNRLAPIGTVGELLIQGPILAKAYHKNAEKTAASFVDGASWLPKQRLVSGRLYKTGDLVRYNSKGLILYVGRKNQRKKMDGQGIEPDGHSIPATGEVSRFRPQKLAITIPQVLRTRPIDEVAPQLEEANTSAQRIGDTAAISFELSPIQKLQLQQNNEFRSPRANSNQFNHSLFLRLSQKISSERVQDAVKSLIQRHLMLSARISRCSEGWKQQIVGDVAGSEHFRKHSIATLIQASSAIEASQTRIDIQNGPVFAVDFFDVNNGGHSDDGEQYLFVVASRFVVDLSSWSIIRKDLEHLLFSDAASLTEQPFSFQTWTHLQSSYARKYLQPTTAWPFKISDSDFTYWGMKDRSNKYGDTIRDSFTIDRTTTSKLMSTVHAAFKSETVEVLLAALMLSFKDSFRGRQVPPIFIEGHGREPWIPDLDLSSKVGPFTTLCPLYVPMAPNADIVQSVKLTKDICRRIPADGWAYFNSRFSNEDGIKALGQDSAIEIMFNYVDLDQGPKHDGSILQQASIKLPEYAGDVGRDTPRHALIEISAVVKNSQIVWNFTYNRYMKHQQKIRDWINRLQRSLRAAAETLPKLQPEFTLSDFPHLSLTYQMVEKLQNHTLRRIGIHNDEVEDAYPCTPLQCEILKSQGKKPAIHRSELLTKVRLDEFGSLPKMTRIYRAWQAVVDHHPILRTVLVQSVCEPEKYDQIVLKHVEARISIICSENDSVTEAISRFHASQPIIYDHKSVPHRLIVAESRDNVYVNIEISQALSDRSSLAVILGDFSSAYSGKLENPPPASLYRDYVSYLQHSACAANEDYWNRYLDGLRPCLVSSEPRIGTSHAVLRADIELEPIKKVSAFCVANEITIETLLRTVWALVLRLCTRNRELAFGYLGSGRDVPIDRIEEAVGLFLNILICRCRVPKAMSVKALLNRMQHDSDAALEHQTFDYAALCKSLHANGPLFNTFVSFQTALPSDCPGLQNRGIGGADKRHLSFEHLHSSETLDYDVVVTIAKSERGMTAGIEYSTSTVPVWRADRMAKWFQVLLSRIIRDPRQSVESVMRR
ncbi:MAG: hypothetical protein M1818_005527 [Claussenomyces sp. TS43310]|nr:MAG: hypothetical protein M1818_005527 [Claussenomyces sp. TS43310]